MGTHDNVYIPRESWPFWTWLAIEFAIVLAASTLISREITDSITSLDSLMQNWVFYSIVGVIFFAWYVIIRGFILKKPIFSKLN